MQAGEDFFDERVIVHEHQVDVEDGRILIASLASHPLADLHDLIPGGDQSVLQAQQFAGDFLIGDIAFRRLCLSRRDHQCIGRCDAGRAAGALNAE